MKIKWYGHASFLITAENGKRVITDPYTPETSGYMPIPDAPDIVIISSDNDTFHCRADLVPGSPVVVNALELAKKGGQQTEQGIVIHSSIGVGCVSGIEWRAENSQRLVLAGSVLRGCGGNVDVALDVVRWNRRIPQFSGPA